MLRHPLVSAPAALVAISLCLPPSALALMGGELQIFTPSPPNLCRNFGVSVDLDGPLVAVGAPGIGSPNCPGSTPGAAHLYDAITGVQLLRIDGVTPSFGQAVALANGRWFVSDPGDDDAASNAGSVSVFDAATGAFIEELWAADAGAGDFIGRAIAAEGDLLVVGAENTDDLGVGSGSAYVFDLSTGQQLELHAPDGAAEHRFGKSVAISGGRVLVGAPGFAAPPPGFVPTAYVFDAATGAWIATLRGGDVIDDDGFGWDVALDGTTAVVGAPWQAAGAHISGAAYVFDALSGVERAKLGAAVPMVQGYIGRTVAVEGALAATARGDSTWGGAGRLTLFDLVQKVQIAELTPGGGTQGFGADLDLEGGLALAGLAGEGITHGVAFLFDTAVGTAVPYCFGSGSGGTACPCSNAGAAGHGCANSDFASGARLYTAGQAVLDSDTLVLRVENATHSAVGLFLQGNDAIAGGAGAPFGDGLRCAGTAVVRLELTQADAAGAALSTVAIGATGDAGPGDVRRYQWWYRDPVGSPCGSGFNLSNGLEVVWGP